MAPFPINPWVTSLDYPCSQRTCRKRATCWCGSSIAALESNRVRVGIGHVGGGPPDDTNAETDTRPALEPQPSTNAAATNLAQTDVQTILQQAASAASALGKAGTSSSRIAKEMCWACLAMPGTPLVDDPQCRHVSVKAWKAQSFRRQKRQPPKPRQPRSSARAAMRSQRARRASSFRNIFHQASAFVQVVHSTASSSLPCLAATSKSRRRGSASRLIRAACRFIKTA